MKSSTATPYPQRIGEGYHVFKAYLKILPILLIFCAGLFLAQVAQAQTRNTHDFSTPATLSGRVDNGHWDTKATITIGGIEYELTQTGNGSWENRGNGGANGSASLYYNTAADSYVTIKRKDNQNFKFYGLWLSYDCFSDGVSYKPPHLTVTYSGSNLAQDQFNERNQQGLVLSKDVEVDLVMLYFSGLHTLNLDNLVVGPVGISSSANADLFNLTLSGTTLSPVFSANTVSYTASVANAVASVSVTPTKADANAAVSINGTALTSGVTSRTVNLNVGANIITIVVTAQNGSTKTYTVTVTRAAAPSAPPVAGYVNALQFDGVNDYVEIPSQPSNQFDSETEFTVSLWFKANNMNRAGLFNRPSGGGDMQFWLTAENGIFIYGIDKHGYGWTWLSTPTAYKLGEWVQVTTVRRNVNGERRMEIYANGVLVGSDRVNFTSSASSAPIRIGTVINADGGFANGQIDNVSLWKKALTAQEIKTLGATTLNGNEAGLAGYWRFDETSGTIAYDATANANHGTLKNMDLAAARVASTAGDIITKKNVAYSGKLTGSDSEGKPLSYSVVTGPSKGALSLNASTGAFTYTPNNNAVGADYFSYRVSNGTTVSNTATVNVTIVELAAPSVPDLSSASDTGLSNNDNITNDNTPTFVGTATPGYTVTLYSGVSVVGTSTADGAGNWSITTATLADGAHTMTAKAGDGTGSQSSASAALTVVIDTTAPNTTITSTPSTLTNSTSGIFSFTSTETGSSFQASVDGSLFTLATSPLTLTGLSEGTHTLEVRAVDVAGNVDPTTASYTWTVDLTAPVVTNITRHNPATEITNASTVTYLVSFSKSVTGVSTEDFTLTGTGTATGTIGSVNGSGERYQVTVSGISGSGTLRLDMKASGTGITDMVGNGLRGGYSSGQVYTIEATQPSVTYVSVPANATYRAGQNLDFTINFDEAVVVDTQNGTPILGLTVGLGSRQAIYLGGAGSSALIFRYTVQPGDLDKDGITLGTIALNGGTITDAIGNAAVLTLNGVPSTGGVLVDAVAPSLQTVTIASSNSDATKAKVGDVVTLRVEASELIAQPAVMIAGRTATVTAVSTTTYTASYTLTAADAEGTVPFTINYQDMAGNAGTAVSATTNNSSVTFDKTAPTGTLAINNGASYTASTAVALSISATDALTGVAAMRFSNDNTTWSGWEPFAVSKSWTLPAENGPRQVYAQLRDGAGNIGLAQAQITVDNVPLTLTLTSNVGPAVNTSFEVLFAFSKAATGFTLADLNVLNATASNLMTADNEVYKATITPSAEGEVKISVPAGVAVDAAGNGNAASNTLTTRYDNTRPVVTLASEAASLVRAPFDVTFTFSEQVTGFTIADITVMNGSADGLVQTGDKVYTARITPDQEGEVTVALVADAVQDAAGNDNLASQELKRTYDSVKPTLLLTTTATNPTNAPFNVTFTFSEEVSGFALDDISVANGTVSNLAATDVKSYSARITPSANGEVSISVAAEKAQDAAGNFNAASNILKINYDAEKPTVVLATAAPNPTNRAFQVSITFNEPVTGFTVQDITIVNATLSGLATTDNQHYTLEVSPLADGLVTLSVPANVAQDAAGNLNTASNILKIQYDAEKPTVVIATSAAGTVNAPFPISLTFSKEMSSLAPGSIAVINGTVTNLVKANARTYTALVTPLAEGRIEVSLPADAVQDVAGNGNQASNSLALEYDITSPTVTLATTAPNPTNHGFEVRISFSEKVSGLSLQGIVVTNATLSELATTDNQNFTIQVTPLANGEVTLSIPAGLAQDAGGNGNLASTELIRRYDAEKPQVTIASAATSPVNAAFTARFTFTEEVAGFDLSDITVTNGVASDFIKVSVTAYTALITPASNGEITVTVAADKATDEAGNGNLVSNVLKMSFDTNKPTLLLATAAPSAVNAPFNVSFTFSKAVTGFDIRDITVTNGSATNFSVVDARSYTVRVTPAAAGEVTVQVPADAAMDAASNGNLPSNTLSLVYDAERPAVVLATTAPDPTNRAFQVSVTFTEPVAGFTVQSITVTNATLSGVTTTDNQHFTIEVTPLADGLVSLSVPDGVVADAAGNRNTASQTLTRTFSATRPTLDLSTNANSPTNAAFEVTFTFSKEVTGFELGDIDVSNGTAAAFTHVSTQVYTARITPDAAGEVIIAVKENVAHDRAGNGNTEAVALKLSIDKTQPKVALTSSAREKLNAAFKLSAVFSEAVTGFAASDVTVVNGTVTGFAAEGDKGYILEITPQADGEVRVSLAAGVAQDAAGNLSLASEHLIRFYDNTRPAAQVATTVTSPVNAAFAVRFTFSEVVESFELANITVENGSVSNLIKESATVYTALVTPSANGMVTVAVAENQTQDAYGNGNLPSNRLQVSYDVSQPTLVLSATAADVVKATFEVTFTFSKEVTGFALEDIAVTNGSVSALKAVSQAVYTVLVTPLADGEVSIAVAADVARDAAGNGNKAAGALIRIYDATSPTLVLSTGATSPTNAAFEVVFTFSEPISGFTLEDILAEGGIVSGLVPSVAGNVYTATITPSVEGEVAVSVAADVVQDRAGNGNLASHVLRMQHDKTRPTIILATTAPSLTNASIPLTIEFSEPVTGFDLADITITNGTASDLMKVSETKYSALVVPARDGEVSIAIAENKVADAATNGNTASNQLTLTYDGTAPVGYAIAWSATRVDVSNLQAITLSVTGAEPGTTYTYHITSGQESTAVSGMGEVTEENFRITNLDLEKLKDGHLTVRLYLTDKAGNKGAEVAAQVLKITRNIASVTAPEVIQVPIRTTFEQVPLPATVGVTYSTGEAAQVKVRWEVGNYDGTKAGQYVLTGTLELAEMTTNLGNLTAKATVEVQPNKAPTALAFSATTFKPEATADEVIGTLSTTDPDDTEFVYTLASGEGDTHNALFEIRGDQVYLKSNKGLSGMTTFTIRVRSTDPYLNTIERTFTLTKQAYDRTVDQLKIVNAFSPNGDGINDNWTIPELRFYNEVHIQVFDRSGVRVFETRDPETGWNGRSTGGQVLKGPFLYIVEVKDINWVKRGVVTILSK